MKTVNIARAMGTMLIAALLVTACGSAVTRAPSTTIPTIESTKVQATESSTATEAPATTATPVATDTQSAVSTETAGIPVTGGETVLKATVSEDYGHILADADGRAVYLFTKDTQNGGTSACTDEECTTEWEPLVSQGDPVAGPGTIQNQLGTITRDDGTIQVTYNGWPLYYFSGDAGAGSTNGQGMDNAWFLVAPSGKAIRK